MVRLRELLLILFMVTWISGCSVNIETFTTNSISAGEVFSATPIPTQSSIPVENSKTTATILSAGDVIMHDALIQSGKGSDEKYCYHNIFKEIRPFILKADYSVISFEGVSMDSDTNYTGYPLFNAPPVIISAFSHTGFDMVNNGNNHCLDRKLNGLLETRTIIKQNKMQVIGTYPDTAEPRHKIQDINGIKVGFLAYTYGCNMNENLLSKEEQATYLSLIENEKMKKEIEELSPLVDTIVVLMHWGVEYQQKANGIQKELADNLFLWGADIILGSHPHVVQSSEIREVNGEAKYLIYGMGNFLSNQIGGDNPNSKNNDWTEDSVLISLALEKDMKTEKTTLVSVTHIPTWVYRYTENGTYQYTIYPIPSLESDILKSADEKLAEKLRNSYQRTMEKMQDYPLPE